MGLSAAQLELRRSGIGSSDIAAIVGLASWGSAIDVWLDKTGRGKDFTGNVATRIGNALEPLIAELYAERTGARLSEPAITHVHPTDTWRLATPDRVAHFDVQQKVVECKNDMYNTGDWGDDGTDQIPDGYLCQVQWQLDVLGLHEGDVAALIGQKLHVYHVRRDEELCGQLREAGARFWRDHVIADVQPPLDSSEGTKSYLERKHPRNNGLMVAASVDDDDLAARLASAKIALDSAKDAAELLMNQLRARIGDNDGMQGDSWKATWRRSKDKRKTNWEGIARELGVTPELLARFTTIEPGSRRFLFTPPKET